MTSQASEMMEAPKTDEERRAYAIKRIKEKNDFRAHLIVYLAVNTMLVVIWFMVSGGGFFFWPIIPILGWGVGLVMHGYSVYRGNILSESEIQREMKQLPG